MQTKRGRSALRLATGLLMTLPLASCATPTGGGAAKAALCDQFKPIQWDVPDTDSTIAQAKAHNAVGVALCGWKPGR